jgi:hypothetical protein
MTGIGMVGTCGNEVNVKAERTPGPLLHDEQTNLEGTAGLPPRAVIGTSSARGAEDGAEISTGSERMEIGDLMDVRRPLQPVMGKERSEKGIEGTVGGEDEVARASPRRI